MKIETERLKIVALTPEQLDLWTHNMEELERYRGGRPESTAWAI